MRVDEYLASTRVVDWKHPAVTARATELRAGDALATARVRTDGSTFLGLSIP